MVPVVALVVVAGVVGVAILLLRADEVPLLVELDLTGRRGNSHELVVELFGLVARAGEVACYGVPGDPGEATGGADAAALAEVVEDGDDLVGRQLRAFQGGALTFGVGLLAGAAVDHADLLAAAAPTAEINIAVTAFAVVGAGGIVAEAVLDA